MVKLTIPDIEFEIDRRSITRTGQVAKDEAKRLIRRQSSGGKKWPSFSNSSSNEGNPPNNQSGDLKDSIKFRTRKISDGYSVSLSSNIEYAAVLEQPNDIPHGFTGAGSRKFMMPALRIAVKHFKDKEFSKVAKFKKGKTRKF